MELKRAKEVLRELFEIELSDERLASYMQINFCHYGETVNTDGRFTADQLEAIATWMRDPEGVVKA